QWNNQGKYPLLIANSCYNGNIFYSSPTKSEEFVFTPNAGVIAYLGTLNYGFSGSLYDYSHQLYKQFSLHNYGGTIGQHIKNTIDSVMNANQPLSTESVFQQMTLHGDPMLRINWHTKPEIELTDERIVFGPQNISLNTDSLTIDIKLRNLGQSITDTFALEITRDFPGSPSDSSYVFSVAGLDYEKDIAVKIPFYPLIGVGLNQFTISADIPNFNDEVYDEVNNNRVMKSFNISVDGIEPILPMNFAVVPRDTLAVFGSTIDPLAPMNSYRFEIDTTHLFNSSFKRYALKSGTGGVKSVNWNEWLRVSTNQNDPVIFSDSTVYYWRVAVNGANPIWKKRSFQYIPGKEGWGQDDFFQFTDNAVTGISMNTSQLQRQFIPIQKGISCLVKSATTAPQIYDNAWFLNGEQQEYEVCNMTPKLHVAVLDKGTLVPWETRYTYPNGMVVNPNNNFGNANDNSGCKPRAMKYFTFHQNSAAQLASFQNLVQNVLQNGDYLLVYSPMTTRYDWWNTFAPSLYQTFANLGSDSIVPGRPNKPFIFLTQKGNPSFVVEKFTQGTEDILMDTVVYGSQLVGYETTPLIGPVDDWQSLFWKRDALEFVPGDSTRMRVQVYNAVGALDHVIDTLMTPHDSIINLNNLIDAAQFPYARLNAFYTDTANQTPAQLDFWHVVFAPLPEAAIDPSTALFWSGQNDSIQ
ncbi:MAG: C25 family cysteine peptidase, partial [Bacteroidota bacterium]